jgi:transcriptional regulator with XRE-family HTH domain
MAKGQQPPRQWRQNFLREWRKYRGFSVERLAAASGMSPGNISLFENRKQGYSEDGLEKLAAVLRCHPGDILNTNPMVGRPVREILEAADEDQQRQILEIARVIVGGRAS